MYVMYYEIESGVRFDISPWFSSVQLLNEANLSRHLDLLRLLRGGEEVNPKQDGMKPKV